ncbi:SMP-30/gluconolactonase/LRE family protein [Thermodesulfobacteriota bacterium]
MRIPIVSILALCLFALPPTARAEEIVIQPTELVAAGLFDAENLAFDGRGRIFISASGCLYVMEPDGTGYNIIEGAIDFVGTYCGLAIGPDGFLYAACYRKGKTHILRIDIEAEEFPYTIYLKGTIKAPNGLRFDDDGTLYAADFAVYMPKKGKIWRIEPGPEDRTRAGRVEPQVTGLWGPNGIVMDRNRGRLYFTETFTGDMEKDETGAYGTEPKLLLDYDIDGPRFPIIDDLALDAQGNLYACCYNSNQVLLFSPEGTFLKRIKLKGVLHPTAIAFTPAWSEERAIYVTQKGHMFFKENKRGDRLSRFAYEEVPYRLPFLKPVTE